MSPATTAEQPPLPGRGRLERGGETPDHAEEVAGQLDDRRRIGAVLTALGALRRPEREVLLLCLWQGMEYADAARSLGVPVGTVRSRLSRARKKLRKLTDVELAAEIGNRARRLDRKRTIALKRSGPHGKEADERQLLPNAPG